MRDRECLMAAAGMGKSAPEAYARAHRPRFVAELMEFIRFPSVAAQPGHAGDVRRCAAWLARHLRAIGMERVALLPTRGHPLVYAAWRRLPERPTVLIYGHYDVQPVDPLAAWVTPPFTPAVRGADLYGRGASDDKGQLFAHVKALEAWLRTAGRLPINVICLFEGEEEIGSPNLQRLLAARPGLFAADVAVLSDMRIPATDRPALTTALRGMLSLELEMHGPAEDLHSGTFGGAVRNPLQALCELVASFHDEAGRVAIAGFYDRVRAPDRAERAYLARVGPADAAMLRDAGLRRGWGERGYTLFERTTLRPALTINGLSGGYAGAGPKAVIPARASAKLSFRLVPDQDPREIDRLVRRHIARATPPDVRSRVQTIAAARPTRVDPGGPALRAAAAAYRRGFGAAPIFLPAGGTIPVVGILQEALGLPVVLMGFALPGDRMHAPNEKFHLPNFDRGIAASIALLAELAGRGGLVGQRRFGRDPSSKTSATGGK